ncbi:MAG: hypothetical protein ACQEQS_06965 [Thermodesulfobacteriota bacterium]
MNINYAKYHTRNTFLPISADIKTVPADGEDGNENIKKGFFLIIFFIFSGVIWDFVYKQDIDMITKPDNPLLVLPEIIKDESNKDSKPDENYYRPSEKKENQEIKPEKKKEKLLADKKINPKKNAEIQDHVRLNKKEVTLPKVNKLKKPEIKDLKNTDRPLLSEKKNINPSTSQPENLKIKKRNTDKKLKTSETMTQRKIKPNSAESKNLTKQQNQTRNYDVNKESIRKPEFHAKLNNSSAVSSNIKTNKNVPEKGSYYTEKQRKISSSFNHQSITRSQSESKKIKLYADNTKNTYSDASGFKGNNLTYKSDKNNNPEKNTYLKEKNKKIKTTASTVSKGSEIKKQEDIKEKVVITSNIQGENKRVDNLRYIILNKIINNKFKNQSFCCTIQGYKCTIKVVDLANERISISFNRDGRIPFKILSKLERKIPEGLTLCTN